jgi:hypothetical protein
LEVIIVAFLSLIGNLVGSWSSNNKVSALISYRLDQLESKVEKHNQVIERTFKLEERTELQELEIEHAYKRIDKLEKECCK